jgi:hypothetical protein
MFHARQPMPGNQLVTFNSKYLAIYPNHVFLFSQYESAGLKSEMGFPPKLPKAFLLICCLFVCIS